MLETDQLSADAELQQVSDMKMQNKLVIENKLENIMMKNMTPIS